MELPGGILLDGVLGHKARFRPITGDLELLIAETSALSRPWPYKVTSILCAALDSIGDAPVNENVAAALCIADRQFLMGALGVHLGHSELWIARDCDTCGEAFDFPLRPAELPVKPPGPEYPHVTIQTSLGEMRFKVPDGAAQTYISAIDDLFTARFALIKACLVDGTRKSLTSLSEEDVSRIEQALEDASPELAQIAEAQCPHCKHTQLISVDTALWLSQERGQIYAEIHRLAGFYHWSEGEILSLPRWRRHIYLELVARYRQTLQ